MSTRIQFSQKSRTISPQFSRQVKAYITHVYICTCLRIMILETVDKCLIYLVLIERFIQIIYKFRIPENLFLNIYRVP